MSIKSPKVELEFEIDFSEITHKGLQRMLRAALAQTKKSEKPLHRRDEDDDSDEVDDETNESDKERTKIADLAAARGTPAPIPTTDEDFKEAVADTLPKKKAPKAKKA